MARIGFGLQSLYLFRAGAWSAVAEVSGAHPAGATLTALRDGRVLLQGGSPGAFGGDVGGPEVYGRCE